MTAADLSVLGVDDVELRQLELALVAHGHGGVVPPVGHLGHRVRDCDGNTRSIKKYLDSYCKDRSQTMYETVKLVRLGRCCRLQQRNDCVAPS